MNKEHRPASRQPAARKSPSNRTPHNDPHHPQGVRLQKVLATAGFGSRRACEEIIRRGRVKVNGKKAELGLRIDPATAVLHVDDLRVQLDDSKVTLAVNKPRGVLSAMSDERRGRPTLGDIVADRPERLFHVGRLDAETEGLILMTNDGDLGHRLAHPSFEVPKTYLATVAGRVSKQTAQQIRQGVQLQDGPVQVHEFRVVDVHGNETLVELTIHEGRNHIVRRLMAQMGHQVQRLVRTRLGSIRLGNLKPGTYRAIAGTELGQLMREVEL